MKKEKRGIQHSAILSTYSSQKKNVVHTYMLVPVPRDGLKKVKNQVTQKKTKPGENKLYIHSLNNAIFMQNQSKIVLLFFFQIILYCRRAREN